VALITYVSPARRERDLRRVGKFLYWRVDSLEETENCVHNLSMQIDNRQTSQYPSFRILLKSEKIYLILTNFFAV